MEGAWAGLVWSRRIFRDTATASKHIAAGAKKVIITAPAKDPDVTVVLGVNEKTTTPQAPHHLERVVNTTNCLATTAKVRRQVRDQARLHDHGPLVTNDQPILTYAQDLRRARAGASA